MSGKSKATTPLGGGCRFDQQNIIIAMDGRYGSIFKVSVINKNSVDEPQMALGRLEVIDSGAGGKRQSDCCHDFHKISTNNM